MPRLASPLHSASLFAGLFVVCVLFELPQQATLLQLHIEALESAVDRLIGLYVYVNQFPCLREGILWHVPSRTLTIRRDMSKILCVETADSLGIGLYSVAEAARLLHTPRRTISRWVEGYVGRLRTYPSVLGKENESTLAYGDLIELLYVRGFRKLGVSLEELRIATHRFKTEWHTSYPLATERFAANGRSLLWEFGGVWRQVLDGQQSAFFDELATRVIHDGNLAVEYRPLGASRSVVLSPHRAFGKPIDSGSGTHTYLLANALQAEKEASRVAWWYGTTTEAVLDASEFESQLVAA